MQLSDVLLSNNKLGGTLPETWSKLTSVSPIVELTCLCKSVKQVLPCHIVLCKSVPQTTARRAFAAWLLFKRPLGFRQQWLSSTLCQQGPLRYLSLITTCQCVPVLLCIDTPSGCTQSVLYLILCHVWDALSHAKKGKMLRHCILAFCMCVPMCCRLCKSHATALLHCESRYMLWCAKS